MVNNPSFESSSGCPVYLQDISKANGWSSFSGSVDYYSTCAVPDPFIPASMVGVPNNLAGYQLPASGNSYAGLSTYYSYQENYREYLGRHLSVPLSIGHKYFISFKTNLAFSSDQFSPSTTCGASKATNGIGVKFSTYNPSGTYSLISPLMDNHPAVYSNTIITDTANWTTVFGSFIADSSYTYVLLGNFFDDTHTAKTDIISWGTTAYYFLDDICVSKDSVYAATYVGIEEDTAPSFSIYPNPAKNILYIDLPVNEECVVSVYNSLGQLFYTKAESGNFNIDVADFRRGIYFVSIRSEKGMSTKKIIIED